MLAEDDELRALVREAVAEAVAAEFGTFARVLKPALCMAVAFWDQLRLAPGHNYRAAVRMVIAFLERRYGV